MKQNEPSTEAALYINNVVGKYICQNWATDMGQLVKLIHGTKYIGELGRYYFM